MNDHEEAVLATLREQIATLRALLREAAPKCAHRGSCTNIATWHDLAEENPLCDQHKLETDRWHEPYDLGVRIKAALEGEA